MFRRSRRVFYNVYIENLLEGGTVVIKVTLLYSEVVCLLPVLARKRIDQVKEKKKEHQKRWLAMASAAACMNHMNRVSGGLPIRSIGRGR